jgi:enoyl-CoA hydratase/carnithine racemase
VSYQYILFDVKDGVGTLTLNFQKGLNALMPDLLAEVAFVLETVRKDKSILVLVITGSGKCFSAGGNIQRMKMKLNEEEPPPAARDRIKKFQDIVLSMRNLEQPIIGSINGPAVGAGCSLALACDLRIASEKAKFGLPHVKLGITTDGGAMYFLPYLVGTARALELLLSGDLIKAEEAERIGLVNRVVPHEELQMATTKWATQISKVAPYAMRIIKNTVYKSLEMDLATELELEAFALPVCLKTDDHKEGVTAFIEKRKPKFT